MRSYSLHQFCLQKLCENVKKKKKVIEIKGERFYQILLPEMKKLNSVSVGSNSAYAMDGSVLETGKQGTRSVAIPGLERAHGHRIEFGC